VVEVLLIHWTVFGILHIRGLVQVLIFMILALDIIKTAKLPRPGVIAKTYILLLLYSLPISLYYGTENLAEYVIKGPLVSIGTYFAIFYALHRTNDAVAAKWINQLVNSFVGAVLISNAVAIGQYLDLSYFWSMRDFSITDYNNLVNLAIHEKHRPVGMASNSVELGYHTVMAISFLAFKTQNKLNTACMLWLLLGQIACENRSAIATIIIFGLIFLKVRWSPIIKPIFIFCVSVIIAYFGSQRLTNIDSGMISKIYLIYFGIIYVVQNPFGTGLLLTDFLEFRDKYDFNLITGDAQIFNELSLYTPHNQLLTTMIIYGFLGLFALFYIHFYVHRKTINYEGEHTKFIKAFSIMFILYFVNSMVHNAGIFVMDPTIWYFIPLFEFFVRHKSSSHFIRRKRL
jgi:hypothetical protein